MGGCREDLVELKNASAGAFDKEHGERMTKTQKKGIYRRLDDLSEENSSGGDGVQHSTKASLTNLLSMISSHNRKGIKIMKAIVLPGAIGVANGINE